MHILENIIVALATAIVFCDLIEMIPTEKFLKFKRVNFDTGFFITYMNENTNFLFLNSEFDKASFVPMDDKRFVIMIEKEEHPSYREMIFEPFYYAEFDGFRRYDTHLVVDNDVHIFRFGAELIYETKKINAA